MTSTSKADNAFDYEPSVSVTSDLDEPQQLGFCIDIYGWGSSMECDNIQTHSCKRSGDDTQFEYHSSTKSLRAVNYDAKCNKISASITESRGCVQVNDDNIIDGATLVLGECDESMDSQRFTVVESSGNFELHIGTNFCLVVSDTTRPANGWVARDLMISTCNSVPEEQKTWTIRPTPLIEENNNEQSPTPIPTRNQSSFPSVHSSGQPTFFTRLPTPLIEENNNEQNPTPLPTRNQSSFPSVHSSGQPPFFGSIFCRFVSLNMFPLF